MFLLNTTEEILLTVFLVTSMMSIGMQTKGADARSILASRSLLIRALLANFVVVPVLGVVVTLLLPLQPPVTGALILLACTPGGLSAIQFTSKVKGRASLAAGMLFLLSLLALFVSPLILMLLLPGDVPLVIPYGRALLHFVVLLILPLLAGMLWLARMPESAGKLSKGVALAGVVAFIAFMVATSSARNAAAVDIGLPAVGSMLLFIVVSMVIGWFMGGPTRETRRILATSTSMRNAILCLVIAESSSPGHAVLLPLIAFSLLMVPPNMLYTIYGAVQARREARKSPQ